MFRKREEEVDDYDAEADKGYVAFWTQIPASKNPYHAWSIAYDAWLSGWIKAFREFFEIKVNVTGAVDEQKAAT